jgi:hypothetical protein
MIQANKRIGQIGVDRKDGLGPMEVIPHHLHVADRPEHGPQPKQFMAQLV